MIYNPANEELYIAERGKGAFLNDQRLRVAGRRKLNECVIACGLPHIGRGDHELALTEMAALQDKVAGFRRFGAASLDWPSSPPAASTAIGSAICSPGTSRPARSWCARPAASSRA